MSGRLPTHLLVGALLRRVNDAGGMAVVRASGEAQSGALLVILDEPGRERAVERMLDLDGKPTLVPTGPSGDAQALDDYWQRRRARDPDLWVLELSVVDAERYVAETIAA